MFLSKHIGISFTESDSMTYMEFKAALHIASEYLKEIGPQMSDIG